MLALRSALFNALLYLSTAIQMIVFTPYYFLVSRKKAWNVPAFWSRSNMWMFRAICGNDHSIEGLENLPKEGGYILAPKHQSFWDTFALLPFVWDMVIILKRDLLFIPMFGLYLARMNMIAIRRGDRRKALEAATLRARQEVTEGGRPLLIYPEGTRRAPGDDPLYKYGIVHLYDQLQVPVVPVAWNPGLFWPRRRFRRYPGHIYCRVLEPIPPGLDRETFRETLVARLEGAQDELLLKQATEPTIPPFVDTARRRIHALTGMPLEDYRASRGLEPRSPYEMGRR